jgi:hypothetical protein
MFRLLMIAVVSVLYCTQVDAQLFGRRHRSNRGAQLQRYESNRQPVKTDQLSRSYKSSSGLNISIGIGAYPGYYSGFGGYGYLDPYRFDGYGYDPYRYGSFEAPDLLKDPYFRERYRYDSKFPGRYRAPRMPETSAPIAIEELYRFNTSSPKDRHGSSKQLTSGAAASQLAKATEQLASGLAASEYGEAWLEYLAPHQLSSLLTQGKIAEVRELMSHYEGVVANPELQYITATPGFAETRSLLKRYLGESNTEMNGRVIRIVPSQVESTEAEASDQPETLPAPQPTEELESGLNPANET